MDNFINSFGCLQAQFYLEVLLVFFPGVFLNYLASMLLNLLSFDERRDRRREVKIIRVG